MPRTFRKVPRREGGGHPTMRYRLECSVCREGESLGHTNIGEERAADVVPQTFARRGWTVGKTPDRDICPACTRAGRPSHVPTGAVPMANPNPSPLRAVPSGMSPASTPDKVKAEPPREMTRDERRIINAKLDEVYVDEAHGYSIGWNDDRVAADLGIARAWVAKMRDENFGPDHNIEVTKARGEVDRLTLEMGAASEQIEEAMKLAGSLLTKADALRADLARLTAAATRR